MSHITKANARVHNLDALGIAAKELGMELKQQTKFRSYSPGKCEYALINPNTKTGSWQGGYDVGIVAAADGNGYELLFDPFNGGGGLMKIIGEGAGNLLQKYTEVITLLTAQAEGQQVLNQVTDNTGATYITVNVPDANVATY